MCLLRKRRKDVEEENQLVMTGSTLITLDSWPTIGIHDMLRAVALVDGLQSQTPGDIGVSEILLGIHQRPLNQVHVHTEIVTYVLPIPASA